MTSIKSLDEKELLAREIGPELVSTEQLAGRLIEDWRMPTETMRLYPNQALEPRNPGISTSSKEERTSHQRLESAVAALACCSIREESSFDRCSTPGAARWYQVSKK